MHRIDGSQGEGGGQVLRTALGLSLVTGEPFEITKIRAGRQKPGLLRQHLTAVQAATELGDATTSGAELGSQQLRFAPRTLRGGVHRFAIGSAGSTTLVLQAVLPALLRCAEPSTVTLVGGTHNPNAPPYEFLERVFFAVLRRMGAVVGSKLFAVGFHPAGGGSFEVTLEPGARLSPLVLVERGALVRRRGYAISAHVPRHVAERELVVLRTALGLAPDECEVVSARGPGASGNLVQVELAYENACELVTAFGRQGHPAELVAREAADAALEYLRASAPVGEHLADQLLIPCALAGGGEYRATTWSSHARTNAEIVARFLPVRITATEEGNGSVRVVLASVT